MKKFEITIWKTNKKNSTLLWSGFSNFYIIAKLKLEIAKMFFNSSLSKFDFLFSEIKES
jgi:hypothetical protein